MSQRSTSGSGSGTISSVPSVATTTDPSQVSYPSTCTFVKQKDTSSSYGCYTYRSCQSCLQTEGCVVNDLGICVNANQGLYNLETSAYESSTNYYPPMNYLNAIKQNLALPGVVTTNVTALSAEQNWHFRAGEATYCSASDATCQECKQKNFYQASDFSVLPDSRFCVGQNGCVCIQTCEVPTYKVPGCQWKFSSPPSYGYNNGYGSMDYNNYYPKERLTWWNWLLIVVIIVVVHFVFKHCGRAENRKRHTKEAREEAVRAVRQELGIITGDAQPQPTVVRAVVHQPQRSQTVMSDSDFEESYKDDVVASQSSFVEVVDATPLPRSMQ